MTERYWLIHPNGGRQRIDPTRFDLDELADQAKRIGGRLIIEGPGPDSACLGPSIATRATPQATSGFDPPISALPGLFRNRLDQIHLCEHPFVLDINTRPTVRVLGNYYRRRRLVQVYTHDKLLGRRPLEELFDTFLHEVAHHLEYSEPQTFHAKRCGRVRGRMHSPLFWTILAHLKARWLEIQ
jgi:hypothetical protein